MNPELIRAGMAMAALALVSGGIILLLTGSARSVGAAFREALAPLLSDVRSRTSMSRSELADLSVLVAIVMAAIAIFDGNALGGTIVVPLLHLARPSIRRATQQEHPLLALSSTFSLDLIIGFCLPFALAHMIVGNWFMGLCMFAIVLALSWPAGGQTAPGRRWMPAPSPA